MRIVVCGTVSIGLLLVAAGWGWGQSAATAAPPRGGEGSDPVQAPSTSPVTDSGTLGFGVKVSTFGLGAEAAVRVTHGTNLRAGFNVLGYSRSFNKDGVPYSGHLNFKTFELHYDIFPWARSFHVSPGLLVYFADPIKATLYVPATRSFTLGGVDFISDPRDPVSGTGKIDFNRAAPMITVGWGNLIPRKEGQHFSVPVEIGVAFQGSPKTNLALSGSVCDPTGINCRSVSDPLVQSNIVSEQNKLNSSMSLFKAYPMISVGFGYKF